MTPLIIAILMAYAMPGYSIEANSSTSNSKDTIETNIITIDEIGF